MRRAAAGFAVALLAGAVGAAAAPSPARIELARDAVARSGGAWLPAGPAGTSLGLAAGVPLDVFLRLPASPVLEIATEAEAPAVAVAGGDGRETALGLSPSADGWRAPLDAWAGRVVRLRFTSDTPARLVRARVTGEAPSAPPLLRPPGPAPGGRWNVMVYVVDALRADRLGLYGYARPTSPRLDALAARSTVFENAYATGPDTLQSIPALFTSLPADRAARRLRFGRAPRTPTLAEVFRAGGYATAAFQANFLLKPYLGFDRGFGLYRIVLGRGERGPLADAAELHAFVFQWIQKPRPRPFFLYVQSLDVHNPYRPPPPFRGRFGGDPAEELDPDHYDDAVAYQDRELGALVAALGELGLRESTVVVVTSDHGESLGEGGRVLHGRALTEELVRVPLIVSFPGAAEGRRERSVVSLVDLGPTLLELADQKVPPRFLGHSLLQGPSASRPRVAVGEKDGLGWFVRERDWKLVVGPDHERQLHDLVGEAGEERDVSSAQPIVADYLTGLLWRRSRTFRGQATAQAPGEGLGEAEKRDLEESLRALGYIE